MLADRCGWYLRERAAYSEAERLTERALEIRLRLFGPEHLQTAVSFHNLANVYQRQGRYSEAAGLCVRALAIRERELSSRHIDVTASLNNLANL